MERGRESHWQAAWLRERLADGVRVPGREKFYAVVAYPGSSGFLHLGHLRGLTTADALHRFHRMRGRAVFFPTGTHASGLPAVTFAQKVANRDAATVRQLEDNQVPPSEWGQLEDPAVAARFLGRSYLEVGRKIGLLVDERAYLTTIDEDYAAFIRWQFHALEKEGALVQAPHFASVCPVCGPVSVDPSETDLSSGGDAEWITYTTVPFRLEDGRVMLAATLRPETVYGVTNLWVNPTEPLVIWHHGSTEFVVGRVGAHHLVEQHGGRVGHELPPSAIVGRQVRGTIADHPLPILASPIVDPGVGTGVVMSVPAHAPADWIALQSLAAADHANVAAPPVIVEFPPLENLTPSEREILNGEGAPAERAVRATGATSLADAEQLGEATERLYRLEFLKGRMRSDLLGGTTVMEARNQVGRRLLGEGLAFELQEFSKPVICRNGHEVVIRRVPDQWFIQYSEPAWKARTRDLAARLTVYPEEYARELPSILDWFGDRPCTRRGRWLGTPFPADPSWVIEPIADSTFYPVYYVIRPYVADGRLPVSSLTDALFDYVFRGIGPGEPSVDASLLRELREAFTYWYPLDFNIGGKEHKRVHFPVFLATHALLLPPEHHPKGLFVHWWLTQTGGHKISKKDVSSKGGAMPPLPDALSRWSADALRLFYAMAAGSSQDIEWNPTLVDHAQERLNEIERIVRGAKDDAGDSPELDAWLASEMHVLVRRVNDAFARIDLREAAEQVYVAIPALLRRAAVRAGDAMPRLGNLVDSWVRLMVPITPHIAEELGEGRFSGLVAVQLFPSPEEFVFSEVAVARERYLDRVEEDLREVLRPALARGETVEGVSFFVANRWKREVEGWIRESFETGSKGLPVREVMERAKTHGEVSASRAEIPRYVQRVAPLLRQEPPPEGPELDELSVLKAAEGYLARRLSFRFLQAFPENEGESHDPLNRRERARPGRPAFYLVGSKPAAGSSARPST